MWNLGILFSYEDEDIGRFSNLHKCTFKQKNTLDVVRWHIQPKEEGNKKSRLEVKGLTVKIWKLGVSNIGRSS